MATGLVVVEFDWHHSIAHPRIPPTRRKRHRDIFYTSGVCFLSVLSQFSLPWQPGSVVVKFDWHHLITCPGKLPGRRKHLADISYRRRVIGDFALNFVAMATGLVVVEFVWHHSMAHERIPPTRRKRHRDIFYTSGVIVCFVSNFVAMATRVGRFKIWLTSFDSPTWIIPWQTQSSQRYLLYKPSYSRFCPKFRCHGNGGWSWQKLSGVVQ